MSEFRDVQPTVQQPAQQRTHRPWGKIISAAIVVLVVGVWVRNFFPSKALRISPETTLITEPLTPDGKRVDYFARIERDYYPDNIATDENGFRLIVQHIVRDPDEPLWVLQSFCKKLGLDPDEIRPDLSYGGPIEFLREYDKQHPKHVEAVARRLLLRTKDPGSLEEEDGDSKSANDTAASGDTAADSNKGNSRQQDAEAGPGSQELDVDPILAIEDWLEQPWTFEDVPMMQAWLEASNPALDVCCEAANKPIFFIPLARKDDRTTLLEMSLFDVDKMRKLVRGLLVRANYRIGAGDLDGAIRDILACKRLGRKLGHGVTVLHLLSGIAIEGLADSIGIAGSPSHRPTKTQLEELLRNLQDLPPQADPAPALRFERYMANDSLQRMAHGQLTDDGDSRESSPLSETAIRRGIDWNIAAKRFNTQYDIISQSGEEPEPPSKTRFALSFVSRRCRSEMIADLLVSLFVPAISVIEEAPNRGQCSDRMRRIVVAMLLYERDHGTLPPAYTADAQGNPLHSWRVLLLPYLGHDDLYQKIRLEEPWNSQHNQPFHKQCIAEYRCPTVKWAEPGQTTFSVVVGPEMPFEADKGKELADFDALGGHLILLAERVTPVCWMNPVSEVKQMVADAGMPSIDKGALITNGIGSRHAAGANLGFRNGAVMFLNNTDGMRNTKERFQKLLRGRGRITDDLGK